MSDDDITYEHVANYAAWDRVITRDFTTQTHIIPQFDESGGWVLVPVVQVYSLRSYGEWSEESLHSAKRFDAFMERQYAATETAAAKKERERWARDILESKRLLGEIFGDEEIGL